MSEAPELEAALWAELSRLRIPARPVVLPTPWRVGPITAYLFGEDPVTLVDTGVDTAETRRAWQATLDDAKLTPRDVRRIVVTHGHTDHFGCAAWFQEASGCEVLLHRDDADSLELSDDWREAERSVFEPLGVSAEVKERLFSSDGDWDMPAKPRFTYIDGDEVVNAGSTRLRLEHHPGHTPGHIWAVEEVTGAIFCGDFLLASSPTSAGLELDAVHPLGRKPLLAAYNAGLRELASRDAPVLLPAHGPPIIDHAELIDRRLRKTERRTERVWEALRDGGPASAGELAERMFGERLGVNAWGLLSDTANRLDLLYDSGRVVARHGDDGVLTFDIERSTDG